MCWWSLSDIRPHPLAPLFLSCHVVARSLSSRGLVPPLLFSLFVLIFLPAPEAEDGDGSENSYHRRENEKAKTLGRPNNVKTIIILIYFGY